MKLIRNIFSIAAILINVLACTIAENDMEAKNLPIKDDNLDEKKYSNSTRWDFKSLDGWVNGSQNMDGEINYEIINGILNIYTRAQTWDRPKVRTINREYGLGRYTWRVFLPEMGVGDMASVGAFLYNDDTHELDFEIGYGSSTVRDNLKAANDDLIVYLTSQDNPFRSVKRTIKRNMWYTLEIELLNKHGKYQAVWFIDNIEIVRLDLNYEISIPFYIFCSVENLTFMGDHIPNRDNYGLFDYMVFQYD